MSIGTVSASVQSPYLVISGELPDWLPDERVCLGPMTIDAEGNIVPRTPTPAPKRCRITPDTRTAIEDFVIARLESVGTSPTVSEIVAQFNMQHPDVARVVAWVQRRKRFCLRRDNAILAWAKRRVKGVL